MLCHRDHNEEGKSSVERRDGSHRFGEHGDIHSTERDPRDHIGNESQLLSEFRQSGTPPFYDGVPENDPQKCGEKCRGNS